MAQSLPATRNPAPKPATSPKRWYWFVAIWFGANLAIWGLALIYLIVKSPAYTSQWTVTLPGVGSTTNVDLPGIGRTSAESDSPYRSSSDPRENYKFIAQSDELLERTAAQLKIPVQEFAGPRVKILDNTTLIQLEMTGRSPQEAQKRAQVLQDTLDLKLNELRTEELLQQDRLLQVNLGTTQKNLQTVQQRLSAYKARTGLSSSEQLRDLSVNIEQLRRQRAEILAQLKRENASLGQLSSNLRLSVQEAADAFILKSDPLFQQHLDAYSTSSSELVLLESQFSFEHPQVMAKQAEKAAVKDALYQRGELLLGVALVNGENLGQLNLSSGSSLNSARSAVRENLFQELILLETRQKGLDAQAQELGWQIAALEGRLRDMGLQESNLGDLERNVQIAEAIFSSTLARLDLSKSDLFASYPQIQVLTRPSLPAEPSSPKTTLVLLGAIMASFFMTTGIFALWWRDRKLQLSSHPVPRPTPQQAT